ncbi:hypothetical protein BSKO_09081 [Bryopsis sp. KO-2023]|nr:hypothetical protein BSKO_09081 [Bryopsis sp. KO-2023]
MDEVDRVGLAKAKRAVAAVMRTKGAKMLFNEAVDPEALGLPDYFDVIANPIDLGTISRRLDEGHNSGWTRGWYRRTNEVLADVSLVWGNCYTYNCRECDAPTRGFCDEVKRSFEKAWRDAGLAMEETGSGSWVGGSSALGGAEARPCVREEDVPESLSVRADGMDLPLRLLDDFSISIGGKFVSLDKMGSSEFNGMTARGVVVSEDSLADGSLNGGDGETWVQLSRLLDWSVQYGDAPGIWIVTKHAWYRLLRPSEEYEEYLRGALDKFELCTKATEAHQNGVEKHGVDIVENLVKNVVSGQRDLTAAIENGNVEFAKKQLTSWLKAGDSSQRKVRIAGGGKPGRQLPDKGLPSEASPPARGRPSSRKRPRQQTVAVKKETDRGTPSSSGKGSPSRFSQQEKRVKNVHDEPSSPVQDSDSYMAEKKSPGRATRSSTRQRATSVKFRAGKTKEPKIVLEKPKQSTRKPNHWIGDEAEGSGGNNKSRSQRLRVKITTQMKVSSVPTSANVSPGPSPATSEFVERSSHLTQGHPSDSEGGTESYDPLFQPANDGDVRLSRRRGSVIGLVDLSDSSDSEEVVIGRKKKRLSEFEKKRLRRAKEDRARLRKDLKKDNTRREAPAPTRDFRTPEKYIGDVLSLWEFVMAFPNVFQIPPFPLWRLEAAMSALPRRDNDGNSMMGDGIGPSFRRSSPSVIDRQGLASGVLLRDIHIGLLRVVEGKGAVTTSEAPRTAKAQDEDRNNHGHWFQRISLCLLRAPIEEVDDETRMLAQFLQTHDYVELDIHGRLKILQTLVDMALGTELMRDKINGDIEGGGAQKKKADGNESGRKASQEMSDPSSKNLNIGVEASDKWMEWLQSCRLGFMKILGEDIRGRRYWAIGGRAGAWRIFVESFPECYAGNEPDDENPHGGPRSEWGWYEGSALEDLMEWLREGGLHSEKSLLHFLERIPKLPQIPVISTSPQVDLDSGLIGMPSTTGTLQTLSYRTPVAPGDYDMLRADGYSAIVAPFLRGEGECPEMSYCSPLEHRVVLCIQTLLGLTPFWIDEQGHLLNKICRVIEELQSAQSPFDMARELLNVEQILFESDSLISDWGLHWRNNWKTSTVSSQTIEDVALHITTLQEFTKKDAHRLHRVAFNTVVGEARCPLYFPLSTESVVFLRTGCLLHLQKFLGLANPPPTATPAAKTDVTMTDMQPPPVQEVDQVAGSSPIMLEKPDDLRIAKERVSNLKPVERFKIVCIAYRSPFACDYSFDKTARSTQSPASPPFLHCMWLLMQPIRPRPGFNSSAIAVPIHIDNSLPDFVVKIGPYDQGTRKQWKTGERFRMFFGGKASRGGQGGVYYKGTVVSVEEVRPGESYDPWESLTVEWDNDTSESPLMKVSPWEIEIDPEEEKRLEEERRREEEAKARAARAAAKQQRTEYIASLGAYEGASGSPNDPDFDPEMDIPGLNRSRRRGTSLNNFALLQEMVYYDPSNPVGPVSADVIQALPERDGFTVLIYNFMRRLKGKFKCPIFAGHELDLHRVFHEVQNRGGYDRVTQLKLWKEVCRTLNVNLTGQTSASYNMRLNYEKCLLDFEHYLAKGEYTREVAQGTAPSCSKLDSAPVAAKPRPAMSPGPLSTSLLPHNHNPNSSQQAQQLLPTSMNLGVGGHQPPLAFGQIPTTGFSMTELLLADELGHEFGVPAALGLGNDSLTTKPVDGMPGSSEEYCLTGANGSPVNPAWLRMLAPRSNPQTSRTPTSESQTSLSWVDHPQPTPPVEACDNEQAYTAALGTPKSPMVEIQPGESIGMALNRMGRALVGADVWRRWPEYGAGGWFKAAVTDFRHSENEHCLTYEQGTENEKNEWVDLRELESEELSQYDPDPPPQPPTATVESSGPPLLPHAPSMQTIIQPQVGMQLLGTPPPIHFGQSNVNLQQMVGLIPGGARQDGAPARASNQVPSANGNSWELLSQVLQGRLNSDTIKVLDGSRGSLFPQQSSNPSYPQGQPSQTQHDHGFAAAPVVSVQPEFPPPQQQPFSHFTSLSNFSGPIELSGGCGVLPGFEGQAGNLTSLLFDQSPPKDGVEKAQQLPASDLQISLASEGVRFPPDLDSFAEKKPIRVVLNNEVDFGEGSAWAGGLGESNGHAMQPGLPVEEANPGEGSLYGKMAAEDAYPSGISGVELVGMRGDTKGGLPMHASEMEKDIRRNESFKIKFSLPRKK